MKGQRSPLSEEEKQSWGGCEGGGGGGGSLACGGWGLISHRILASDSKQVHETTN